MGRIRVNREPRASAGPLAKHIGKVLLDLRQRDQVTMRQVSEGSGLSNAFICQIENGQSEPSAGTLWRLAKFFKVPVSHFFKGYREG